MGKECEKCLIGMASTLIIYKQLPNSVQGFLVKNKDTSLTIVLNQDIESTESKKVCLKRLLDIETCDKCDNMNVVKM